jgi:hypothetical protein
VYFLQAAGLCAKPIVFFAGGRVVRKAPHMRSVQLKIIGIFALRLCKSELLYFFVFSPKPKKRKLHELQMAYL